MPKRSYFPKSNVTFVTNKIMFSSALNSNYLSLQKPIIIRYNTSKLNKVKYELNYA